MTDTKHTPGPWEAALERGCHGVIAKSLPEGGANFICIIGNNADTPEREPERFANARLIAAAPDLLEALKGNGARLERWAQHVGNCQGGSNCTCGLTLARHENIAAIAKATGQ